MNWYRNRFSELPNLLLTSPSTLTPQKRAISLTSRPHSLRKIMSSSPSSSLARVDNQPHSP